MIKPEYDSIGHEYELFIKTSATRPIVERTVFKMVGNIEGKSILDLACGFGYFSREFHIRGASKVVGVDISSEMIELARKKAKIEGFPIDYQVQDTTKMQKLDEFDMVTAIWLFDYASSLDKLESMIKVCKDNLKKGGKLVALFFNPNYSLSKGNYTQYGFNILSEEKIDGGGVLMKGEFLIPNEMKSEKIGIYRWNLENYEGIIKKVGFSKFEWVYPELNEDDIKNRDENFWNIWKLNCGGEIGLICYL